MDFTFVRDVVHANMRAMKSDAMGVFNVATWTRISVNDLAGMVMGSWESRGLWVRGGESRRRARLARGYFKGACGIWIRAAVRDGRWA
uniref:Uncharacterized protein n=1 Tax=Candidatus Methanogaster sp. ANME-2c ERB4 TaxID=2759911 RepID=A0A7G9YLB0_9EURY|nr:hypothetical protein IMBEDNDK_00004 [Methanosarcinales archaeon ANME-2c ERB4]